MPTKLKSTGVEFPDGSTQTTEGVTSVTAGDALTGGGSGSSVTIDHADTSSQGSVNNSGGTVIQDVTLDTYGHVTNLNSANLDGRYVLESGDTMTGNLTLLEYTETVHALSGTTPALDPANGTIQTWTLSGNSTPTDSIGDGQSVTLMIDDGSDNTITWPSVTWKSDGGDAPTLNETGFTVVVLWKVGSTLYGARVGDA